MSIRSTFLAIASIMGAVAHVTTLPGTAAPDTTGWHGFRGPGGHGVAPGATLPQDPSITWAIDLPGEGLSSPLVVGEKIIVTCSSGPLQDRLHVICISSEDGSEVWHRQLWATGRTMHHEKTSVAAPTPVFHEGTLFALFSSNDLVALDLEGDLLWMRSFMLDYPNASNSLGLASSPVAVGDTLVALIENDSESFVAGIDTADGTNRWKFDRTKKANWATPVRFAGKIALQGSSGIDLIDPVTGEVAWSYTDGASTIPSSAVGGADGKTLFTPSRGLTAIDENGKVLWQVAKLNPGTASPVATADRVYILTKAGVLNCADAVSGERLWRTRMEGPFGGSPVLAGDFLCAVSERKGLLQVADLRGEEGKVVGTLELGDLIQATPAVVGNTIYVRSDRHLWKIQ